MRGGLALNGGNSGGGGVGQDAIQDTVTSVGFVTASGTFGQPLRYTDVNRRTTSVRNLSSVAIQVGYSTRNTLGPPSWGSAVTVPAGGEFYDDSRGDPLWVRDSAGAVITVSYAFEIGA